MKIDRVNLIKNICSSWLGLVTNIATGIIVSPFILHRLGDEAFGLWVLVFSITGYYSLFNLGLRSSLIKYVANCNATGDRDEMARVVNTTLYCYSIACLILLGITTVGSLYLDKIIRLAPADALTARYLFFIVGFSLAIGFPLAVFGGILEGLQKFYLINAINIINTILRAILIIVALKHGYGLLTAAFITAVLPLINGVVNAWHALQYTRVRLAWRFVNKATFKQIYNFASVSFLFSVAHNLRFKSDAFVIGSFLSAAAITPFAIAGRIVDYSGSIVDSLAQVFMPMSSHLEAKGNVEGLRRVYVAGNRACALIAFPLCCGLIILGKSVIRIWMGARYIHASYPVLLVLVFPATLRMAQATSSRVLFGMARHKTFGFIVCIEGLANIALSILLVRPFGIVGDAIGTAIPLLLTYVVFLPRHLSKVLGLKVRTFVAQAYTAPLLLCIPLVTVLLAMQHVFVPVKLWQLAVQTTIAGVVYAAFVYYFMFLKGPMKLQRRSTPTPDTPPAPEPVVASYSEE